MALIYFREARTTSNRRARLLGGGTAWMALVQCRRSVPLLENAKSYALETRPDDGEVVQLLRERQSNKKKLEPISSEVAFTASVTLHYPVKLGLIILSIYLFLLLLLYYYRAPATSRARARRCRQEHGMVAGMRAIL